MDESSAASRCRQETFVGVQVPPQGFSIVVLRWDYAGADQLQGCQGVGQEVADGCGHITESSAAYKTQAEIAQSGEVLGRMPGTNAASVLAKADVTNEVESVLDGPVQARDFQQSFSAGPQACQTGDGQHNFHRSFVADSACARKTTNLLGAWPFQPKRNLRQCFDGADLDTTVTFVMRRGGSQVLLACHFFRRGKKARRTRRGWPVSAPVGYP